MMDFRTAIVQYGDFRGEVAIDGYHMSDLYKLAEDRGLPDSHFLVGIDLYGGEGSAKDGTISVSFVAVKKSEYGASVEEIQKRTRASGGIIEVEVFDGGHMPVIDLFRYVKRLNIRAANSGFDGNRIEYPYGAL